MPSRDRYAFDGACRKPESGEFLEVDSRRSRPQTRHFLFGREGGAEVVLCYTHPRLDAPQTRKANVA